MIIMVMTGQELQRNRTFLSLQHGPRRIHIILGWELPSGTWTVHAVMFNALSCPPVGACSALPCRRKRRLCLGISRSGTIPGRDTP